METTTLIQIVSGSLPVLVIGIWAWRIYAADLTSRYRFLFALLCWFVVSFLIMAPLAYSIGRGGLYRYALITADGVLWVLWVCVLLEVATLTVEPYDGFVRLGQKLVNGCLFLSGVALVGLWTLAPPEMVASLFDFWRFEAVVVFGSLSLICIIFAVFAAYFRLTPPPNVKVIYGIVSAVLIGNVVTGIIGRGSEVFYLDLALHFVAFLAGALAFSPALENSRTAPPPSVASGVVAVQQLEGMNQTLLRLLNR